MELGANWLQGLAGNPVYDLYMTCRFNGFQMNGTLQNWDSVVTFDQFGKIMANKDIPWKQFSNAQACAASTVATAINANNYNDVDVRAALRVWWVAIVDGSACTEPGGWAALHML